MFADNAGAIKRACRMLGIPHEKSQPGIHETIAVIERKNLDIEKGSRASLAEAGLPACFWIYSIPHYCFSETIMLDDEGTSAWFNQHKEFPRTGLPIR